ncbi:MAG: c-type cytochrome [Flavobacteriales bacterium]
MGEIYTAYCSRFAFVLFTFAMLSVQGLHAQEAADPAAGKKLFTANCASCHRLDRKLIGPPLRNIAQQRNRDWLHEWIRNNAALRDSGDRDARAIFEEYKGQIMTAFSQLSDQQIDDIIAYTSQPAAQPAAVSATATSGASAPNTGISANAFNLILLTITALLLLIIILLTKVLKMVYGMKYEGRLRELEKQRAVQKRLSFVEFFEKYTPGFVFFGLLFFVVAMYGAWVYLIAIDVNTGYEPIQPIAFSHEIHAGENKIDCQYCHSSAKHSKTAGIPSANVCMNCHRYIAEGPKTGTREIAKIYKAVGWDPDRQAYIPDYKPKPIKWVKIHNLPDFVYFNHAQHVVVGQIACQTCHGPVETMDTVYQYSKLTMGWCIDCHRATAVQMKGNPYYEKIHAQLAAKYGVEKVTEAMMGGLECGRCHY